MIFEHCTLTSPLDQHLESIFYFKDLMPYHSKERVVPTGHVYLIFELDGFTRSTYNEMLEPLGNFAKTWISGMHRNFLTISSHQKSEMLVVQFKAGGAFPFLHFPLSKLNESVLPSEEIFGIEILTLRDQLKDAADIQLKFQLILKFLDLRFDESKVPSETLQSFLDQLKNTPTLGFQEHFETYPHTPQYLIRQFKRYVGLTPKYYQRILRFNEILQKVKNKEIVYWTDIAYQCGYADQSHFIKEFRHFSGFNPSEFIRQNFNLDEANFFPLDR